VPIISSKSPFARSERKPGLHEYPEVTPLAWGERFHDPTWVNKPAMQLIEDRGGHP
jgi:hypothetical protein